MKAARQRIQGELLVENGRFALLLHDPKPGRDAPNLLYLGYALVVMGPEHHIFPSFVLDDWGNEIRGVKLYRWIRDNGNEFPRAEIFGFAADGSETQLFTRELELYVTLPCYAYDSAVASITEGRQLSAILLPDAAVSAPERLASGPVDMQRPLRSARVQWWRVPLTADAFNFDLLK